MRKIFLTIIVLATTLFANAIDKTWNFADWESSNGYATNTLVDGLMLNNPTGITNFMAINGSSKNIDGTSFLQRAQLNGAGFMVGANEAVPTQRFLSFSVSGNSTVEVWCISANSQETRRIIVSDGTKIIGETEVDGVAGAHFVANYTGEATTLYLYGNAGLNLYQIKVTNYVNSLNLVQYFSSLDIVEGDYIDLASLISNNIITDLSISSSDDNIAEINNNYLNAKRNGNITLTISYSLNGIAIQETIEKSITKNSEKKPIENPFAKTWNFSTWDDVAGYPQEPTVVEGLTFTGAKDYTNFMAISPKTRTIDGITFTKRAATGGGGVGSSTTDTRAMPTKRYISFPVEGDSTIDVWFGSSGGNPTVKIIISDGTKVLGETEADAMGIYYGVDYIGEPTTLYIYSEYSGIDLYQIKVTDKSQCQNDVVLQYIADLQNQLTNANNKISNLQNNLTTTNNTIGSLQTENTDLQNQLSTANSTIDNLENNLITANNTIGNLQNDLTTANSTINSLQTENTNLQNQSNTANSTIDNLENNLITANNTISTLQSDKSNLETLNNYLTTDLSNCNSDKNDLSMEIIMLNNQIVILQENLNKCDSSDIQAVKIIKKPIAFYSTLGIQLENEPANGIYIVVFDDGSTEKRVR